MLPANADYLMSRIVDPEPCPPFRTPGVEEVHPEAIAHLTPSMHRRGNEVSGSFGIVLVDPCQKRPPVKPIGCVYCLFKHNNFVIDENGPLYCRYLSDVDDFCLMGDRRHLELYKQGKKSATIAQRWTDRGPVMEIVSYNKVLRVEASVDSCFMRIGRRKICFGANRGLAGCLPVLPKLPWMLLYVLCVELPKRIPWYDRKGLEGYRWLFRPAEGLASLNRSILTSLICFAFLCVSVHAGNNMYESAP